MNSLEDLCLQKQEILSGDQPVRARNAAEQMGVSEAQYVALSLKDSVVQLDMDKIKELFIRLEDLGELMALTRNDQVVMEHHGIYKDPQFNHGNVMFTGRDIDLRLRIVDWQFGFAVEESERYSLQFFDGYGRAAHKIYVTGQSDLEAYQQLVSDFQLPVSEKKLLDVKVFEVPKERSSISFNEEVLRQEWWRLENAHHVNKLLKVFGLSRSEAYRHLGEDAKPLQKDALKSLLTQASENGLPLLMFVPNGCATQIHNGPVEKLLETGPWFNVLDPNFNLHAQLPGISEGWLVKKYLGEAEPTVSLEFFNDQQQAVMMVYLHTDARDVYEWETLWGTITDDLLQKEVAA